MEDPTPLQHGENQNDDEQKEKEERQRLAQQKAIEQMLLAQEEAENNENNNNNTRNVDADVDGADVNGLPAMDNNNNNNDGGGGGRRFNDDNTPNMNGGNVIQDENHFIFRPNENGEIDFHDIRDGHDDDNMNQNNNNNNNEASSFLSSFLNKRPKLSYISTSFIVAFGLIFYALRSRQQWYLALVFLTSSKWAYIILGNALVAFLIWIFQLFTRIFMNGLRLAEAEGLGDFFRWNVTDTCLALTMFRQELDVQTGTLFLILILAKCLHWVADMREGHLRMTEEAVYIPEQYQTDRAGGEDDTAVVEDDGDDGNNNGNNDGNNSNSNTNDRSTTPWPAIRWSHLQLLFCLCTLQLFDIFAVVQCGQDIMQNGPSVSILFAFEGTILLVSVASNILLWYLHAIDGLLHYFHETTEPTRSIHHWVHPWKDHKATLIFAVEVQAQAAKFLFYISFFGIVMSHYGMPINLFREVYMSFQALRQRLVAFGKYRQLMASMNKFASPTEEELEEEYICIICRDEMTVETSKRLPGCGHIFHKSCLREWLVQQQTCPTCRGDITAMAAREQQQQQLANQRRQQQEQAERRLQQQQQASTSDTPATEPSAQASTTSATGAAATAVNGTASATSDNATTAGIHSIVKDSTENETTATGTAPSAGGLPPHASNNSFPPNTRGKRVRIIPPTSWSNVSEQETIFPAFYRVVQDEGATVYNDSDSNVVRVVPFGLILIGQELAWKACHGENKLMIRMPDGWIPENSLERIVAIPFSEKNPDE